MTTLSYRQDRFAAVHSVRHLNLEQFTEAELVYLSQFVHPHAIEVYLEKRHDWDDHWQQKHWEHQAKNYVVMAIKKLEKIRDDPAQWILEPCFEKRKRPWWEGEPPR